MDTSHCIAEIVDLDLEADSIRENAHNIQLTVFDLKEFTSH